MHQKGFFITGTDTQIGKTTIACALLRGLQQAGHRTVGLKPIASGAVETDQGWCNEDALALQKAASIALPYASVNPYIFRESIAPHLAAENAGVTIRLEAILKHYTEVQKTYSPDYIVVEGAGGILVPINERENMLDLARTLSLPLILVVGVRLGCINHALLSAQVIYSAGLPFAGWIANVIDQHMLATDENILALQTRLRAPLLGKISFNQKPETIENEIMRTLAVAHTNDL